MFEGMHWLMKCRIFRSSVRKLLAFPDAKYHTNTSISSFETTGDTVMFEIAGQPQRAADLLVCADGA